MWITISFSILLVLTVAMVIPYIPLYGEEIGLSVSMIGYVIAVYHITQVIGRIPLGSLSDAIGYKKIIGIGGFCFLFGTVSYILSSAFRPLIFIAQILLGVAVSITWVTIPAFITQFGRKRIPVYTFSVGWAYTLAVPLGGFLKDKVGMHFLFITALVIAIPLLVCVVLIWKNYPASDKGKTTKLTSLSILSIYKNSFLRLKNPRMMRACLFSFLIFMSFAIGFSLLPLYLSGIGLTSTFIGIVQFSRMSTGSSIRLLSKKITGEINREKILTIGTILIGVSLFLISFIENLPVLILISVLWGLSGGLYTPIVFELIADETKTKNRGAGMGIRGTMGTLGSSSGVLGFSILAEATSISASIAIAGITIAIGALITETFLQIYRK